MRHAALAFLSFTLFACSAAAPAEATRAASAALSPDAVGDSADTSCQVVLRHTYINFESSLGPQTDCSSGTCWVMITVTFDVAMSQSLAESAPYVLYQGEGSTAWEQSAQAEPTFGAPEGFRRYQVLLASDTFTNGPGDTNVQLVPFIAPTAGGRLFDHNRVADPLGAYELTPQDNWTINDDASACPGAPPASTLALTFATGWTSTSTGALAPNGKLDVSYDIYRMPQVLGCTTDGVDAFATSAYVRFSPGGQVLTEIASGPFDQTTGTYASLPLEFDVPAGTTQASLWFMGSSDCGGGNSWDSDFGQNYNYSAP